MFDATISSQRVFIVGDKSLFDEGLSNLLTFETNLLISGSGYNDESTFLRDVAQAQPHVVILNESAPLNPARLLDLLISIPSLAGWRVIIVRLNNNTIDVYDSPYRSLLRKLHKRWQFNLTNRDDLIAVVKGAFRPN
jgi:DNA-binding NarL/FixJ family response regulator